MAIVFKNFSYEVFDFALNSNGHDKNNPTFVSDD